MCWEFIKAGSRKIKVYLESLGNEYYTAVIWIICADLRGGAVGIFEDLNLSLQKFWGLGSSLHCLKQQNETR